MPATRARPFRAAPLTAVVLAACLAVAACGGGGDGEEGKIADVLKTGLTSEDPAVVCRDTLSGALVRRVYGSEPRCLRVERRAARRSAPPTSVRVSDTSVDGDRATAVVALQGGDADGASGALGLVRQDGDWRVDDLSADLLRSRFEAALRNDTTLATNLKACVVGEVDRLGDAELRALAYGSIGERSTAARRVTRFVTGCRRRAAARSAAALRTRFEARIARSLRRDGATGQEIACVQRELRRALSDKEIVELHRRFGDRVPSKVADVVDTALAGCRAG